MNYSNEEMEDVADSLRMFGEGDDMMRASEMIYSLIEERGRLNASVLEKIEELIALRHALEEAQKNTSMARWITIAGRKVWVNINDNYAVLEVWAPRQMMASLFAYSAGDVEMFFNGQSHLVIEGKD